MPAELSGLICGGIVLLPHVYVTCICVYVNVVACSEKLCWTAQIASFVLFINIVVVVIIINIIITKRRATRAYYYYQNHRYASTHALPHMHNHTCTTTHAQPHMLTTTHSAPRDKQTVRLAWLTDSRRTTDTGMNDLPPSQQLPTSDDTPARDTSVSTISCLISRA